MQRQTEAQSATGDSGAKSRWRSVFDFRNVALVIALTFQILTFLKHDVVSFLQIPVGESNQPTVPVRIGDSGSVDQYALDGTVAFPAAQVVASGSGAGARPSSDSKGAAPAGPVSGTTPGSDLDAANPMDSSGVPVGAPGGQPASALQPTSSSSGGGTGGAAKPSAGNFGNLEIPKPGPAQDPTPDPDSPKPDSGGQTPTPGTGSGGGSGSGQTPDRDPDDPEVAVGDPEGPEVEVVELAGGGADTATAESQDPGTPGKPTSLAAIGA